MAVSKAAIGATAGTGTAAAAATTALTVGGGTSSEKISDSLDSVSEPSINGDDSSIPKATEKTLDESANLEDTLDQDELFDGPSELNEVSDHVQKVEENVKGPEISEKSPDELLKEEINNKSPDKKWSLTNDVFISSLYSNYCLQRLFVDDFNEDEITGLSSPNNYKVFEGNDRKAFGCLGAKYLRMNKNGSEHWKGISSWGWGIRKGDEAFMYLGSFKNDDDNGQKIKYFSKTFHMKKVGDAWENKYYKKVDGEAINISDSSKKIPKGSKILPNSNEDYAWGLYSEESIKNACAFRAKSVDSNCGFYFSKSGDLKETDSTKYWFWEEGTGNTKFKDMQSNFDDWWADAFGNTSLDLKGVHEKNGSWIEWK